MFSRINIDNILLMSIQNFHINITPKTPQSFTGKEKDSETGFSYFGARYYDSDILTAWLSVDPLADKYPNLSPYAYCAWNPVRLVDPDGRMLDEWDINMMTGEMVWVSDRGKNTGTNYYNIVDSYGGYYGSYIGSCSDNYSLNVSYTVDCDGSISYEAKSQNMYFTQFHPGMGDNSFSEVFTSEHLSNPSNLWDNAKYAATAVSGFTSTQNVLIENFAAEGSDVSKSFGKAVGRYNSAIKGLGYLGTITTVGASIIQGRNYYNNGGSSWFVGVKLALDASMSIISNIGPIGMGIGFTYSIIDVCTGGFGTNKELNKYMR